MQLSLQDNVGPCPIHQEALPFSATFNTGRLSDRVVILAKDIRTQVPPSSGQPMLTITYPGDHHMLMLHLASLPGVESPDSRSATAIPFTEALCFMAGNAGTGRKPQTLFDEGAAFWR
jgi:hypothetical protein